MLAASGRTMGYVRALLWNARGHEFGNIQKATYFSFSSISLTNIYFNLDLDTFLSCISFKLFETWLFSKNSWDRKFCFGTLYMVLEGCVGSFGLLKKKILKSLKMQLVGVDSQITKRLLVQPSRPNVSQFCCLKNRQSELEGVKQRPSKL